eukprot:1176559-Rhodomonas_salina.2
MPWPRTQDAWLCRGMLKPSACPSMYASRCAPNVPSLASVGWKTVRGRGRASALSASMLPTVSSAACLHCTGTGRVGCKNIAPRDSRRTGPLELMFVRLGDPVHATLRLELKH